MGAEPGTRGAIGAVLAGGRGRRVGSAKATLELGGRALIEHVLAAFADAGLDTVVVAKRDTPLPALGVEIWAEPDQPVHPLRGIVTALERAQGRPVVVCGCDMPFVTGVALEQLAAREARLVVPRFEGRLHPLLARYDPALLAALRDALDAGGPLQEAVAALEPLVIEGDELAALGDPARLLFNVNEPADLRRARRALGSA